MKKIILFMLLASMTSLLKGQQATIVNSQFVPYNVTPESMLAVSVLNNGNDVQVQLVAELFNIAGQQLIAVQSFPFILKQGMNDPFSAARKIAAVNYSSGNQAELIRTTHNLPGGTFRLCVKLMLTQSAEPGDEFCDEIESDFNQFLYLVTPFNKDTVESKLPLLCWSHNEPFNALAPGEFYRMVVTEIKEKQSAEEAVTINTPLMAKNYLTLHTYQYPFDAKELKEGEHYAWQVQKMANNVVVNKTEAWEFIVRKPPVFKNMKYVVMQPTIPSDPYIAYNGKIFFKFHEEYKAKSNLKALIIADNGKEFPVDLQRDDKTGSKNSSIKSTGDNRFELNLDTQNIKPGYYRMVIKNEKHQNFYLKFYLPESL